jgi:nucleoside-diphosphate-sugar epimerase
MKVDPGRDPVLVTGCAGFLGSHLCERLISEGHEVVGVDCFTDFYPRELKDRNLERLRNESGFKLREIDLSNADLTGLLEGISGVYHLAAQPGVRGSFGSGFPHYVEHNVLATQALLEEATLNPVSWFVYASSSSVYGDTPTYPTTEEAQLCPVSPYGMTKVATEEIAGVYHRTSGVPVVGLRYFTAYGPRQRPDMAFSRFIARALNGEPLPINGDGRQIRDFTYVDDVIGGTIAATHGEPGSVYNIGGGNATSVIDIVGVLEELLERPLEVVFRSDQRGDARQTCADGNRAADGLGFVPGTGLAEGIARQLEWTMALRESADAAAVLQPATTAERA